MSSDRLDQTTEGKKFIVCEWTIENFTCWNKGIRGRNLQSEPRSNMVQFELFRWPVTGDQDAIKLWVNISNVPGKVKGDFSLICSDGILIWTRKVDKDDGYDNEFIGVLPFTFYDLASLIKAKEAGDRLILRFRYENEEGNVHHSMHSMFEDRTISMKISLSSIFNVDPEIIKSRVITAEYPLNDGVMEKVKVRIIERPSSKIELILIPRSYEETIFFRTSVSVLHKDGTVIRTEENEEEICQGDVWTFFDSLTRNEVVREELSILLHLTVFPSNTLKHLYTFSTSLVSEVAATNSGASSKELADEHALAVYTKDFLCLLQNKDFSDLQLHCEGVSFPVHKSILSARSSVFKAMLFSDMKEAASSSVDIADLDVPTLTRFLTFLYSGTVNNDDLQSEGALKLYYAADKYQVHSLKTACANVLSAKLYPENVCDVLRLADKHRDDHLTAVARSFIYNNYDEVLMSEEWESLKKRDSFLASKTLKVIQTDPSMEIF